MFFNDDWEPGRMMDGSYGNGMMNGAGWMFVLFGLLLLLLLGTTVFLAIKASGASRTTPGRDLGPVTGSPRDILDLRLARGEITPEEYGTTRSLLGP